jgi:hypothetical protein
MIGQMCAQNIAPPHNDAVQGYFGSSNAGDNRKFILTIFLTICRSLLPAVRRTDPFEQPVALKVFACSVTGLLKSLSKFV